MTDALPRLAVLVLVVHTAGLARGADAEAAKVDPNDPKFAGYFSGQVVGPDDKPLAGAKVYVVPMIPKSNYGVTKELGPVRATTGADGRFEFNTPDMTYTARDGLPTRYSGILIAAADGYGPDWYEPQDCAANQVDFKLQLAKDDVPLHGRFVDTDGRPLAGARVRVASLMIPIERKLDAQLAREIKADPFHARPRYDRSLERTHLLPFPIETQTDADGRFKLSGLGRDRLVRLAVSAPGVVDSTMTAMTRDVPDVPIWLGGKVPIPEDWQTPMIYGAGFTFALKPGLTVAGVVRDRDTKAPIAGALVAYRFNPTTLDWPDDHPWVTDKEGRFTITGLEPRMLGWKEDFRGIYAVPPRGSAHLMATTLIEPGSDVVLECRRAIPFHLKLVDEDGKPVQREVKYYFISPNPQAHEFLRPLRLDGNAGTLNYAARRPDGTYEGFVIPGPGAIVVQAEDKLYRAAHVDPKAFFEPGRSEWTPQELISTYGNHDSLSAGGGWMDQHDFDAIVLVNPSGDPEPLKLTATVLKDCSRQVTLVDPQGQPVVGAKSDGLTFHPYDGEGTLRAASFPLRRLHPDRLQRITFYHEPRNLIGFLAARGDGESPYTVEMQSPATVIGRIIDEKGRPVAANLSLGGRGIVTNQDPQAGVHDGAQTDEKGAFRIEKLVPGLRYSAKIYYRVGWRGELAGQAFENLTLRPGQTHDLGDIRVKARPPEKKPEPAKPRNLLSAGV